MLQDNKCTVNKSRWVPAWERGWVQSLLWVGFMCRPLERQEPTHTHNMRTRRFKVVKLTSGQANRCSIEYNARQHFTNRFQNWNLNDKGLPIERPKSRKKDVGNRDQNLIETHNFWPTNFISSHKKRLDCKQFFWQISSDTRKYIRA